MNDKVKIAKNYTVGDWKILRKNLKFNNNLNWNEAIKIFQDRIDSRFLDPIEKIKHDGKNNGEGFSISLISVVLLEFIAAFELGKIYTTNKLKLCPNEYSASSNLLKRFYSKSNVFKSRIKSSDDKDNFYKNIRCGLVHEARTKGSDVIISQGSSKNTNPEYFYFKVDGEYRLNRDLLLQSIKEHIIEYRNIILQKADENYRKLFIMKIDEIARMRHVWYFIYGSNLNENQLMDRLNTLDDNYLMMQRCRLVDYKFVYNKKSSLDGTSKGNLIEMKNEVTEGVAILLLESTFNSFINDFEKGYEKKVVEVTYEFDNSNNSSNSFSAYTCISTNLTTTPPSKDYVDTIIEGAREKRLPEKYIKKYLFF
jgi:hypothetical protein